jgi:hypothetical protein
LYIQVYQVIEGNSFSVEVKLQEADLTVVLQRYLNRSLLSKIFEKADKKDERNKRMLAAHMKYGYSLKEIADYLGINYSTV